MDKESSKDLKSELDACKIGVSKFWSHVFDNHGVENMTECEAKVLGEWQPEVHDVAQEEYDKEHEVKGPE